MRPYALPMLIAAALALWGWSRREIAHEPGVLVAPDEPVQRAFDEPLPPRLHEGFRITPLAHFEVRARLLGSERYWLDDGAALAPVDFALGWGRMSDSGVLDRLHIGQGGRFYMYRWSGEPPIPPAEIVRSSANMHLIPATKEVRRTLMSARVGHVVRLSGMLVRAERDDGWRWQSSLTRNDTGNGACELVWVEQADVSLE